MADGGLTVLDGSLLRDATVSVDPLFRSCDDGNPEEIDGSRLLSGAESIASALLFGIPLPENLKTAALSLMGYEEVRLRSIQFDRKSASEKLRNFISAIADELRDDPLVITVLDGSILQILLEDEDDFAMLAEDLFTDLDTSDYGKLHKNEVKNALIRMGVEMGVPPPTESDLLDSLLDKHGAVGDEWLGQAQFANILQAILEDLADALAAKHVVVIHDVKVISGSRLRKVLSDEKLLNDAVDLMFNNPTTSESSNGSLAKIRSLLERDGSHFGLPSAKVNEAPLQLYDQVFVDMDIKEDQELDREAFGAALKKVLEKTLNQLQANPIFHEQEGPR